MFLLLRETLRDKNMLLLTRANTKMSTENLICFKMKRPGDSGVARLPHRSGVVNNGCVPSWKLCLVRLHLKVLAIG